MRPRITGEGLLACLLAFLNMCGVPGDITGQACFAQTATPVAPPPATPSAQHSELVKIYTEEVLLPVIATDSKGHFDPSLQAEDLLILEDGKPQTISSVRRVRIPAAPPSGSKSLSYRRRCAEDKPCPTAYCPC
jgi:hypothetical protein